MTEERVADIRRVLRDVAAVRMDCEACNGTGRICRTCEAAEESCQCPTSSDGRDCPCCGDAVFVALCEIARQWIYDAEGSHD